jgi:hypothetical protein
MRRRRPQGVAGLVAGLALVLPVSGCCRKPPQEIVEINLALGRAKEACAAVHAPDDLAAIGRRVDEANRLADGGKCRRAREAAAPMIPEVSAFAALVEARRESARAAAEEALAKAEAALARARATGGGPASPADLLAAERALATALRIRTDPCALPKVAELAREAAEAAERSRGALTDRPSRARDREGEERRP